MFSKIHCAGLMIFLILGCAAQHAVIPSLPLEESASPRATAYEETNPFQGFPEKYRLKALEFEKNQELRKALLCWKVVQGFTPNEREASERIETLERRIRMEAERHFLKGLELFHHHSLQAAQKEFMIALSYNPELNEARDYLRHKFNDPDVRFYETKGGDTLKSISQQIYKDPEKDFLIAYFNEYESRGPLKSGIPLMLPIIPSAWVFPSTRFEEKPRPATPLSKARDVDAPLQGQAEVHYLKGVRHFLAEELEEATVEWEETLRLNPDHPKAKKDLDKARHLSETLKKIK